jgi:competence protein ComEC
MAMIAITASFFGRQQLAFFALAVTGFFMLFWQPNYLFDVGFQLSFMATAGIIVLKPVLEKISLISVNNPLREDLFTTLSAQITTLPILLSTFGNVGILSLLANILVLWTVPILMLLGSLAVLVGLFIPILGQALLLLTIPFLFFFEQVIAFLGKPNLVIQMELFPWAILVGYYLLLGSGILMFTRKKKVVYTQEET